MENQAKDPNGIDQHTAGAKLDAGKPDASLLLLFGRALTEVSRVGTFGAKKYSRGGWQFVPDGITRYTAALLRHLFGEANGPRDEESGLLHAAQVAWNALARLELMLRESENNKNEQAENSESPQQSSGNPPLPASEIFARVYGVSTGGPGSQRDA